MNDHLLQYLDQDSFVHRMDGLSKLLWMLLVALAMLTFESLASGMVMLALMFALALFGARVPVRRLIRSAPILFGIGALLGFFHSIIQPGHPVLSLGPLAIKDHGLVVGASYFFRISVVVFASHILIWTTDIRELMAGLASMGVPYTFGFAVFTTLRFLPLIQREVDVVEAAHAIRGRAARMGWSARLRLWQRYVFTVMVNGLRKADYAATAAQLRGIGAGRRTFYKPFAWSGSGAGLLVFYACLIAGLHLAERAGGLVSLLGGLV
jgi:energy-coupling factor transport system permease protein